MRFRLDGGWRLPQINPARDWGVMASGVAKLAGSLLTAADLSARATLGVGKHTRMLEFSPEGTMDPELYARLVASPPDGMPAQRT
jgi:hypothetical protein